MLTGAGGVAGNAPSALHGTSPPPCGSPLTSTVERTASGDRARRFSAVVTSALSPQSCTIPAMRRMGACGSSGTYAAPALRMPSMATTDSTALGNSSPTRSPRSTP